MPQPSDLYDIGAYSEDPYDIGTALADTVPDRPRPTDHPMARKAAKLFERLGVASQDEWDPHGWRFFPPSSPTPEQKTVGGIVGEKVEEAGQDPLLMKLTGISGAAAVSGIASESLMEVADEIGTDFDSNASGVMQGVGFVRNIGRSLTYALAGLVGLPEALKRDPKGTLKSMLEVIPHQAILAYKVFAPAHTAEERKQQRIARAELYEDPLGPTFAALMLLGFVKAGPALAKRYRARSQRIAFETDLEAFRAGEVRRKVAYEEAIGREVAGRFSREFPKPQPNVPTIADVGGRTQTLGGEFGPKVPQKPITDPARMLPPPEGVGEGFTFKDASRSKRIPESQAERGMFGGPGVGETAFPSGTREMRHHPAGGVPKRSLGTAPPGNIMDALAAAKVNKAVELKPGVSVKPAPYKPPQYQPFLRSGVFTKIKHLDEAKTKPGQPSIMESASPIIDAIDNSGKAFVDVKAWTKRSSNDGGRWRDILRDSENRVKSPESKALVHAHIDRNRRANVNLGNLAEDLSELAVSRGRKFKGLNEITIQEAMAIPEVRNFMEGIGIDLSNRGVQSLIPLTDQLGTTLKIAKRKTENKPPRTVKEIEAARVKLLEQGIDYQVAETAGKYIVRPFKLSQEFLTDGPRRWNDKISKAIWEDVSGTNQSAHVLAEGSGHKGNAASLLGTIDRMARDARWSPATKKAITRLTHPVTGIVDTPGQALQWLFEESSAQRFRRHGTEFGRTANLFPDEWRETNAKTVLMRYMNEVAHTMADTEIFGPSRQILTNMLDDIKSNAPGEFKMISDLSDASMGVIDKSQPLSRMAQRAQKGYSTYVYGTKIGLGFAPIIQISQPAISFMMDAGWSRGVRGSFRALNPTYRAFLRRQGVIGPTAFRRQIGAGDAGLLEKVPTLKLMEFLNRQLDYASAATGEIFARDLYGIANRETSGLRAILRPRVKWARETLKDRFDIDYKKPLGDAEFVRMTQDYAAYMNHHPNVWREPAFFNLPKTRWLGYLKRFTRQQALMASHVIRGDLKRGNALPLIRAAAGGLLGGDLMMYLRRQLFEGFGGKEDIHPEGDFVTDDVVRFFLSRGDFPTGAVLQRGALVGTLGIYGDFGWSNEDDPAKQFQGIAENLEFSVLPVAASDVINWARMGKETLGNINKSFRGTEKQQEAMPLGEVGLRLAEDMTTLWGSYGYHVSSRWQSNETELKKNKQKYQSVLKKARRAYWDGDEDRAIAFMNEWNEKKHYYPMEENDREAVHYMRFGEITDRSHEDEFK